MKVATQSAKHLGIVAVSAEGAALCFRTIATEGVSVLGEWGHPRITLDCIPLSAYMRAILDNDWAAVGALMRQSAAVLEAAGAEILLCPDNTAHQAFDEASEGASAEWLHIARVVAGVAGERRYERLGVLGTKYLMEGPVYRQALAAVDIDMLVPEGAVRERIDTMIFSELVYGELRDDSRSELHDVVGALGERGCDAVVLGCTELPLLAEPSQVEVPLLDSTRLLAREALRRSVSA